MFKKTQDLEQDFMQYNTDNTNYNPGEKSFLSKVIQVLLIFVLIAILAGAGLFLYGYLQKDTFVNKLTGNEYTSRSSNDDGAKKVYSQEDMQAIMQAVMSKMKDKQNDTNTKDTLAAVLEETKIDNIKDVNKEIKSNIKKIDKTKKVQNKKSANNVDYYNKVVVSSNDTNEDEMINLSKGLDEIVLTQDTPKSEYTKLISKEVAVRENEMRVIVVKQGDSLSSIAQRAYGTYMAYEILLQANPELAKNPNLIHIGQRLHAPLIEK